MFDLCECLVDDLLSLAVPSRDDVADAPVSGRLRPGSCDTGLSIDNDCASLPGVPIGVPCWLLVAPAVIVTENPGLAIPPAAPSSRAASDAPVLCTQGTTTASASAHQPQRGVPKCWLFPKPSKCWLQVGQGVHAHRVGEDEGGLLCRLPRLVGRLTPRGRQSKHLALRGQRVSHPWVCSREVGAGGGAPDRAWSPRGDALVGAEASNRVPGSAARSTARWAQCSAPLRPKITAVGFSQSVRPVGAAMTLWRPGRCCSEYA